MVPQNAYAMVSQNAYDMVSQNSYGMVSQNAHGMVLQTSLNDKEAKSHAKRLGHGYERETKREAESLPIEAQEKVLLEWKLIIRNRITSVGYVVTKMKRLIT